jgi:hypothetical protein
MIIKDECLSPYIIKLESSAYQIYKQGKRKSSVDGTEKDSERFVASCVDLMSACVRIATLKMETKKGVTIGLKDFLKEMRMIKTEMLKITHDTLEARLQEHEKRIFETIRRVMSLEESSKNGRLISKGKGVIPTITEDMELKQKLAMKYPLPDDEMIKNYTPDLEF